MKLTVEKRPIEIVGLASAIEKTFSGFVVLFTDIAKKKETTQYDLINRRTYHCSSFVWHLYDLRLN